MKIRIRKKFPIIRYPSSLIQQNHGENIKGHGYTLWNLKNKTHQHVEIPNEYGYVTIDIKNGELTTNIDDLPFKSRLRVRCFESIPTEVKKVMTLIREKTDVQEVVYDRVPSEEEKPTTAITNEDFDLVNLNTLDHQETLLTKYIKTKFGVEDDNKVNAILAVNRETNKSIIMESSTKSNRWKPKRFEWSNMFSYGEDNIIDFTNLKGLYGLFAPNRSGKSSVMSALSFCMFDKCDRTSKASEVMNIHKSSFSCKLNFEIDGVDYFISREGKSDRKGNVKVETNFWKTEGGTDISLNGEKRSDTNEKIREYLGTYEDFVLTSLSVQNVKNTSNFIDIGHTERKDILSQFLGLGIFDKLYEKASETYNELSVIIKTFNKEDETQLSVDLTRAQSQLAQLHEEKLKEKSGLTESIDHWNSEIVRSTSKLIKIDESVGNWTEEQILNKMRESQQEIVKIEKSLNNYIQTSADNIPKLDKQIQEKQQELDVVEAKISEIEKKNISESYKLYQSKLAEHTRLKNELDRILITIRGLMDKMVHLKDHEYDPNCPFCVKNADKTGKEAVKTKTELEKNEKKRDELTASVSVSEIEVKKFAWAVDEQGVFNKYLAERNRIKDSLTILQNQLAEVKKSIEDAKRTSQDRIRTQNDLVKTWEDRLQKFQNNKDAIQSNFRTEVEITSHKSQLNDCKKLLEAADKTINEIVSRMGVAKSKIEEIEKKVKKAEDTEKKIEAYDYYVKSVCRDGIPYELICGAVPEIEREVNLILNQVGELHAKFETDGKNVIPYISDGSNQWTMGLASGFEKFVFGLAIRVALINLSNLPRMNALIIDEGFGTADADGVSSMSTLFSFLKSHFDFILIISHLDSIKDAVDETIDISVDDGFSKINFGVFSLE